MSSTPSPSARRRSKLRPVVISAFAILAVLEAGLVVGLFRAARRAPPAVPAPSVAVVPFRATPAGAEAEPLGDELAEALRARLRRLEGLAVASGTASAAFKGQEVPAAVVGNALHADAIVTGSVRAEGGRLRVTSELYDRASSFRRWSATYERAAGPDAADGLADEIAEALRSVIVPGRTLAERGTPEAPRPDRSAAGDPAPAGR